MKNLMRKLLPIVLVLTLAAGIVLFIDPEETRAAENKVGSLNFLELNLAPKAKETLVLTGAKAKSYKSSKKSVATVSKKGVITAKKEGTAKITVTDTKGKKYTCKVTVKKNSLTIAKTGIKADNVYTEGKYASIDSRVSSGNEESVSVYLVKPDGTVFLSENMYEPTSDGLISQYAVVNTDNFIGYKVMDNGLILCIERGYYKSNGKKAFNLNFQKGATIFKTSEFDSGVAVVRLGETFDSDIWDYLINEKGKVLAKANIDIEYNKKGEFFRNPSEGMTAYLSEKYDPDNDIWEYELLGYYDAKGKLIKVKTPEGKNYNYGYNFSDGLAAVETNGKIGFIDKKGKLVIPCEYTDFWMFDGKLFYNGMGIVAKGSGDDKKYGVIDKNNKTIIPFEYDYIYSVDKNYFVVGKNNKYGVINKKNKVVVPIKYTDFYDCYRPEGLITFVDKKGKLGIVDCDNNTIISFEYEDGWTNIYGKLALVSRDGKYGGLNYKGKTVIPFEFDDITDSTDDGIFYAIKDSYLYIIKGALK